ncbi:unnamed protein product [Sphagnum balticum]
MDCADARRIESGVRNDFDTTVTGILTGTSQGYIVRGFNILTSGAIGSPANGLALQVDPGSVLHIDASVSGTIFQTPIGTANQTLNAAINTNVSGSFTANSTNYVGLDYNRFADSSTNVTKYIWSASSNSEDETIAPAAQTLTFKIYITTSTWATNVLPIAIVTTDSNGNVTSITDARWLMYSLGTGGLNPNPNYIYPWSAGRTQSPVTTTSNSVNPFIGGDKQFGDLKDWMNAIMSTFLEVKGTPYWFSGSSGSSVLPSLQSLFQDLGNTVVTGSGEISNGILPGVDPLLVTTGTTTATTDQLTLASVSGIANGDIIFATGVPTGTTIVNISGSVVTMSQVATLSGSGIGVSIYSPSVITTPGQINWDQPIDIRVIGSSLSYILAANPSSTDISLSDDQVAYLSLVRDQAISPNLIFVGGSPTIVSVGAVSWTTGLLAGDYIKVAANTVSGYYKILSVDSSSQVTLTTNVSSGDNTGIAGTKAQYAFGSYSAVTPPATGNTRAIQIATRETIPFGGNIFWLFLRQDNGGAPSVYARLLSQPLQNGESIAIDGGVSQELLQYIGAPTAASSKPQYVSALNPGSVAQTESITIGSGATITGGQYFFLNSSGNYRNYYVWFTVNGVGTDPAAPATNGNIEVPILSTDSSTAVATKLANALNEAPFGDFYAVGGVGTVTVTNTSAGSANAGSNFSVGAPFAITATQTGTGTGNYIIHDGDNLTLAVKEVDNAIGQIKILLDEPSYSETVQVVASGATPPSSITGPVSSGTDIFLPNNSRLSGAQQNYTVGSGVLELYLNGQFLPLGNNWLEVGTNASQSNQIQILMTLVVGDQLEFRININGGNGGLQGPPGPAGAPGAQGAAGFNAAGGPVPMSVKTGNYTILTTDCFLAADCTSGPITFTLPLTASNAGRIFYLKKIDSTTNPLTIVGSGSDVVEFGTLGPFTAQGQSGSFIANGGTGYWIF